MAYVDNNTPVIEKITLPSGNSYWIADREIRDVVDTLSQTIAGGVSYNIGWDGSSTPVVGNIPAGVEVEYQGTTYTGTLAANNAAPGAFYLVKSSTQTDMDVYDEYVPVGEAGSKTWELIGNTQADLSDLVTAVSLTKQTDTVIGTDATFTITQPTVALSTGATAGTGVISVATGISSASASGGGTAWNSKDSKTVITSYPGVTGSAASSVTPTTKKLAVTTIRVAGPLIGQSLVQGRTSQTTATGGATASTTNTDWLKGVSVTNKVLTFGAATPTTQTIYSADEPSTIYLPATYDTVPVATGATTTTGDGADIVTDVEVGNTVTVLTGLGTPNTATVVGTSATFTNTQPTITVTPSTTNIKATASGANTAWNNKDSVTVLKDTTDVSVTKG